MTKRRLTIAISSIALACLGVGGSVLISRAATADEIKQLQSDIQNRNAEIEQINKRLEEYKSKISKLSSQSASLQNDVALIENEIALTELDIAATQNQIEATNLELSLLDAQIEDADAKLAREKKMLDKLLFELYQQENGASFIEVVLGAKSFHEIFSAATQLESINSDLRNTLATTQLTRQNIEGQRSKREQTLASLTDLQAELQTSVASLDDRKSAKEVLAMQTKQSEVEYRLLLNDLRQEQQSITNQIYSLQDQIQRRLTDADQGGETIISWPVYGRITTTFHDPTYPFRHLFEHSGFDIAVPQGTPIQAAAPGIVAWAKTGTMYGNYVMIIHANGIATLYAHMSRMDVKADQFVDRGQVIGLSGGRAGAPGSGFSTGPHVHFEVRADGIPVDPALYLAF